MIHQLKAHATVNAKRIITTKCGAAVPVVKTSEAMRDVTIWGCDVTCPACKT